MAKNASKRLHTKEKLKNALITLCDEKGYYDITIGEICDRAGLYRSTFYRYYDTKDEMLREIEHEYIDDTRGLTPTLWNLHSGSTQEELDHYRQELIADMEYHKTHKQLCKFLLSPAGDIYFYNQMVESIEKSAKKNMQKYGVRQTKTSPYLLNYFATGFVSTIEEWLERDDCAPSEIADFLLSMIREFQ